jgi:hypothetical protein
MADEMCVWLAREGGASQSKGGYKNQRVTRLELATSTLARWCSTN